MIDVPTWALETAGWIATVGAIVGVILNNRRLRACFLIWIGTNAVSAAIHVAVGVWALTARDLAFLALAVEGYHRWAPDRSPKP